MSLSNPTAKEVKALFEPKSDEELKREHDILVQTLFEVTKLPIATIEPLILEMEAEIKESAKDFSLKDGLFEMPPFELFQQITMVVAGIRMKYMQRIVEMVDKQRRGEL